MQVPFGEGGGGWYREWGHMGGFCFLNSVVNHRGDFHFLWTVHVYVFYFIVKTN